MAGRPRFGLLVQRPGDWPGLVGRVGRYEVLGLDAVWIPDHFVSP